MKRAAIAGVGIGYILERQVVDELRTGALVRVLEAFSPSFPSFSLYYPSRRRVPAPLKAFIDFMRSRIRPVA